MYVYFFQAEDGIRDTSVTGVQTCALPISRKSRGLAPQPHLRRAAPVERGHDRHADGLGAPGARSRRRAVRRPARPLRSEERRVGNEWSSRREMTVERKKHRLEESRIDTRT